MSAKVKAKPLVIKITVREHVWSYLCYDQAIERLKKLVEAGCVFVTGELESETPAK